MGTINKFNGQYRFLSNFYKCKVVYNGIEYPSSEHAFQAQKVNSDILKIEISKMAEPNDAKTYANKLRCRDGWHQVKVGVMYEIVKAKFMQNEDLKEKLLATGDLELIEGNHWGDIFWGQNNTTWNGENHLGKILMQLRDELRHGDAGGLVELFG